MKLINPLILEQKIMIKHSSLHLDCSKCFSEDVIPVGNYVDDGQGLFVDVKCNNCNEITQCGDGDYFTVYPFGPERKEAKEVSHKIRCNNCMKHFQDEDELVILQDKTDTQISYMKACPDCETDSYLMDLEEEE
jgi:Zn finger protein HypA/HybF involved in hydrogenase expression